MSDIVDRLSDDEVDVRCAAPDTEVEAMLAREVQWSRAEIIRLRNLLDEQNAELLRLSEKWAYAASSWVDEMALCDQLAEALELLYDYSPDLIGEDINSALAAYEAARKGLDVIEAYEMVDNAPRVRMVAAPEVDDDEDHVAARKEGA